MSKILPPTTARDLDATQSSPCCGKPLVLSSPPNRYECRDCMKEYNLSESASPGDTGASGESEGDSTSDEGDATETDAQAGEEAGTVEEQIENGVCPWCDDYSGDHVGQHASSAHPDDWDAHKED